jgi:hypothetical protein
MMDLRETDWIEQARDLVLVLVALKLCTFLVQSWLFAPCEVGPLMPWHGVFFSLPLFFLS